MSDSRWKQDPSCPYAVWIIVKSAKGTDYPQHFVKVGGKLYQASVFTNDKVQGEKALFDEAGINQAVKTGGAVVGKVAAATIPNTTTKINVVVKQ